MGYISKTNIKQEFLNFLRNSDVFSITERNVTTKTDTFTATTTSEIFTLSEITVRNVRTVKINTITKKYGIDYDLFWDNSTGYITKVTISGLVAGDTITIEYDYSNGTGDKIYPDYPRQDLTISSYPRIGFDILNYNKQTAGFGNVNVSDLDIVIKILTTSIKDNDDYSDTLEHKLIDAQNEFYTVSYIKVTNLTAPVPVSMRGKNKVYETSIRVSMNNNYEIN